MSGQIPEISYTALLLCSLLLTIPFIASLILGLHLIKSTLIAAFRMAVQLLLIGFFLKYLFQVNNPFLNIAWLLVMIGVATTNVVRRVNLRLKRFLLPVFISFIAATFFVLFYVMIFVVDLNNILDARYFVVIGGMLLGNSLRGNIIGIGDFYKTVRRNESRYLFSLSAGATKWEALLPFLRESFLAALQPTLASMATMGIVFLPGMMTGQILGGVSPLLAIRYQIVIMIAIYVSTTLAINLSIIFTINNCFNAYGVLQKDIFRK
jgi:putative ABC transport system permease protein